MIVYPNVKINLGLSVLRKREDGYHDLDTLFIPYFDIHDTLEIIKADDYSRTSASLFADFDCRQGIRDDGKLMITIGRNPAIDWNPLTDLCAKAYGILDGDFNLPPVKMFLRKDSPVGAGLGGGSSDAAWALKGLSDLFALGLSEQQLADYAARLGSDCAFFVYNRPMFGTGRGDRLVPFDIDLSGYSIRVVVPEDIHVSTSDAYRNVTPRDRSPLNLPPLMEVLSSPVGTWKDCLVNDFETSVCAKYPEIARAKEQLYRDGAIYASMSGSGSSLFGIFASE